MLKHIKFFTVIFISATLIGCFSDGQRKRVIIIDKSTSVENISPNRLPNLVQPKKTVTKTHKKINKKPLTNKTIIKRKKELPPVTGKVIKSFSKKNQGITIATQPGQAVHAIRKGIVVYSGKIKRHGKMIIIKHALGFYSTYTQNQTLKVQSGDKVTKGQIIALTGKNNFYFEMKKFETPIDPLKYLK